MKIIRGSGIVGICMLAAMAFGGSSHRTTAIPTDQEQQGQPSPAPPSQDPEPPNRMDEKGCCVLKPSAVKGEWEYHDNEIRRQCVLDARQSNADWDFYKDKSCDDVKAGK